MSHIEQLRKIRPQTVRARASGIATVSQFTIIGHGPRNAVGGRIQRWRCSDCAWVFVPSGPPVDNTNDEMVGNFVVKRDKEFKSHVCIKESRNQAQRYKLPKKPE